MPTRLALSHGIVLFSMTEDQTQIVLKFLREFGNKACFTVKKQALHFKQLQITVATFQLDLKIFTKKPCI